MRKNNLWITALAFGLSLSAYGQQAEEIGRAHV